MRSRLKDLKKNSFRLLNNFLRRHERLPRHIRRPSRLLGLGVGHAAELEHGGLRCSPPARNLGSQASEIPLGSPDLPGPRWPPSEAHSSPANPACRSPVGSDVKLKHIISVVCSVIKTSRYIYLTFSSRFAFASSSAVVFFPSPSLSSKKKILSFKLKFSFFISLKLSS